MNARIATPNPDPGRHTDPQLRAVPGHWAARLVQAKQSLQQLVHTSTAAQTVDSILTHVSEHIPAVRERLQPRVVGWIRCRKSAGVSLKLRRVGWQYLCEAIDPENEALVLTWGATEGRPEPDWIVSRCAKTQLPPRALGRSVLLRLRELLVLIPQKEHLLDLNGRVLVVTAGEITIE